MDTADTAAPDSLSDTTIAAPEMPTPAPPRKRGDINGKLFAIKRLPAKPAYLLQARLIGLLGPVLIRTLAAAGSSVADIIKAKVSGDLEAFAAAAMKLKDDKDVLVAGVTALCEKLPPDELASLVETFFGPPTKPYATVDGKPVTWDTFDDMPSTSVWLFFVDAFTENFSDFFPGKGSPSAKAALNTK